MMYLYLYPITVDTLFYIFRSWFSFHIIPLSLLLLILLFIQQTLMEHPSTPATVPVNENTAVNKTVLALRAYILIGEIETKPTNKKIQ